MSDYKTKGILVSKLPVQSGVSKAGSEWSKQDFEIKETGEYGKTIVFTCFGDRMKSLDYCKEGDFIEVSFNIESRQYDNKAFHNLSCWRIEKLDSDNTQPSNLDAEYVAASGSERPSASKAEVADDNDLPF